MCYITCTFFLPTLQLLQEVNSQKATRHWARLEPRVSFWRKCHEQLKADSTDPESVSEFFLSQTETGTSESSVTGEAQMELLATQERCLLLGLAAHWLSLLSPAPLDQLEDLEKKLWTSRVRQRVLLNAIEKESVFILPPPAVTSEMNSYEVLLKEFSFSNISALNEEKYLSLEGLPGPAEEEEELRSNSSLGSEERSVLSSLIGQLLDEGRIHEASRVSRYFSLYHSDLWVVLRCRGLASEELTSQPHEEAADTSNGRNISSCKLHANVKYVHNHILELFFLLL